MKHLSESCLVVDSLGSTVRRELLEEFVQHQLLPYESLFGPDKPHFALDQVRFLIIHNYSVILNILIPSTLSYFLYSILPPFHLFLILFFLSSSFISSIPPSFLSSSIPSFLSTFYSFSLPLMHACMQVDRRWAWFRRLLRTVDSKFSSVCPPHWRLPLRLCLEFTDRTKVILY